MNQALQTAPSAAGPRRFNLEMIGFSPAEKAMLASTFRLTGRRAFFYAEATEATQRTDIYLANGDSPEALKELAARTPNPFAPAVLIGRSPMDIGWPRVEKPIHWMRLFEQLDTVMQAALQERARRQSGAGDNWDGRTFRRAIDQDAPPPEVFVEPSPNESVLVVDDSATVRAFMKAKLAPFRFDVDFAADGETAIDMAQAKAYTCIFLDIMMPGIDGYQVCKRLKGSAATKNTAVVMLTSKSGAFDKFRGNWAGCDAYLGKPVSEDELLSTIAKFLPSARKVINVA
ncbi:response regulator [Janthinobacterium sp. 17J80-10]|uniref:response regulator n=1 Tax=Janthinobacterium sp. 17J80-10 TaxID=2497863 RepID=UPI0010056034|nr:response regulator [Janthinobacterium sp. 17J80-10]QAU35221.1 response regulator [Janthinobacterium sp. 17J80-10]